MHNKHNTKHNQHKRRIKFESNFYNQQTIHVVLPKNTVIYQNLSEALMKTNIPKETLLRMCDALKLDVDGKLPRQQLVDEMVDHIEQKYGGLISFLRVNFPNRSSRFYTAMYFLLLGIIGEYSLRKFNHSSMVDFTKNWYFWVVLASSVVSMSYIIMIVRNYFTTSSQKTILKMINLIERSTKEELEELNHCLYMPLWRKLYKCSFSLKQFLKSNFRGGWTLRPSQLDTLEHTPFQEGILEVLRKDKIQMIESKHNDGKRIKDSSNTKRSKSKSKSK